MVNASLVKELRDKTGAGMMDCKTALLESGGDLEGAVKWLRTKGLANAAKKSGRVTAEGLTAVLIKGNTGAVIEVNSETDFVARNDKFQNLVSTIIEIAIEKSDIDSTLKAVAEDGKSVEEKVTESISNIGENISLRRVDTITVSEGVVGSYVHNTIASGMGKISVLVGLESSADKDKLQQLGKQIAMHIAASNPQALDKESVNQKDIDNEREIFTEQTRSSGKPDNIIEKMVEGRIRKYIEEVALLEQTFIIDGKSKISEILAQKAKELGAPISITKFIRYELGEGIEQQHKNFAEEVAAAAKR